MRADGTARSRLGSKQSHRSMLSYAKTPRNVHESVSISHRDRPLLDVDKQSIDHSLIYDNLKAHGAPSSHSKNSKSVVNPSTTSKKPQLPSHLRGGNFFTKNPNITGHRRIRNDIINRSMQLGPSMDKNILGSAIKQSKKRQNISNLSIDVGTFKKELKVKDILKDKIGSGIT